MNKRIFVVGKVDAIDYLRWELIGVFEKEDDALKACRTQYHFISSVNINEDFGDETEVNLESYYPFPNA
jgi:hypothetical protein